MIFFIIMFKVQKVIILCGVGGGEGGEVATKNPSNFTLGSNSLRCTKILSQCHLFWYFLPSPCKDTFMDDYDGI